ncbi:hypothetical protein ABGB12_24505 [Actinocorallia sp. B10E7]|uniref:hypothetical protein n=1 Tax=Actinocorallia sp. B10E7 TaxID=3153558 RepID=UPI00325EADB0
MSRYPALHAARSEHRIRRFTAAGLPVLAVLSWAFAGLLHQPPVSAPFRGDVTGAENAGPRPQPPEEIAQSATRSPWNPMPAPRGTSDVQASDRAPAPHWTPAATSRPVPAWTAPSPPAPSGPGAQKGEETDKTPRPSSTAGPSAATDTAARPPSSERGTRPQSTGHPAPSETRAAAAAEPSSAAPPAEGHRTYPTPEPEPAPAPRDTAECRGLLLPLLGCPAWALGPWTR